MKKQEFLILLDQIFELKAGTLKGAESLESLNWDSMKLLEFVTLVDEQCGVIITPDQLAGSQTVDQLVDRTLAQMKN